MRRVSTPFLTNDDTYYYLQTAWNARHLGFVTFDGINPTNGVQFLWFSILYGLTFLADDKSAFLSNHLDGGCST